MAAAITNGEPGHGSSVLLPESLSDAGNALGTCRIYLCRAVRERRAGTRITHLPLREPDNTGSLFVPSHHRPFP